MKYGVCLLSNYKEDQQQSMLLYADLLESFLKRNGIPCKRVEPAQKWGGFVTYKGIKKYLHYIDKYFFFNKQLSKLCKELQKDQILWIIHIADHSNALYVPLIHDLPIIITCHDVGAIQGARGELADCPASFFGKILQNRILLGIFRSKYCVAVSEYTKRNLEQLHSLTSQNKINTFFNVILNPVPTSLLEKRNDLECKNKFENLFKKKSSRTYILNVGSNLRRKNREVVLKVFAEWSKGRDVYLVFVGDFISSNLWKIADQLGISEKIINLGKVESGLLAELYKNAFALLFPTRFEGFGWPIIEGQALGVPVIAGKNSSIPEVAGNGAFLCDSEDIKSMVNELLNLESSQYRSERIFLGHQNLERFKIEHFEKAYLDLYDKVSLEHKKIRNKKIKFEVNNIENINQKKVKIAGFGACMMSGYPFSMDSSFYHHAIQSLSKNLNDFHLEERNSTINGCSLIQANAYVESIIYEDIPDIIVLQFGGVDASTSIRTLLPMDLFKKTGTRELFKRLKLEQQPGLWCIFKWKVLGAISSMLSLQSFTPVEHYLNTFLKIVEDCKARGIKIIVITPFRMGNSRSDYFARMFSHALEQASIEKSFECLNSWKILSSYPIQRILLIDGFHLTRYAHQILGNALYEKIQKIVTRLEK